MTGPAGQPMRVLHVDDEPDLADVTATHLERRLDALTVITETSANDALARLEEENVDCIVSDHDMSDMDGLEFLQAVRETRLDLPFILFTGKGSEEIASDAISAGVTDYLQKETGTDQYAVLANRIERAVTERRAKSALEESERRLSTLISNLHGMVYRCSNEPDWPMEFVSEGVESLTGYTAAALESGDVSWGEDVIDEAEREEAWERVQIALDAREPFELTCPITTKNGERRWIWERGRGVYDDGDLVAIEGFVTDVTARKERERELEASRQRYRTLVDTAPDAVFIADAETGTLVDTNEAATELLERSRDDIVGSTHTSIHPPGDAERYGKVLEEHADEGLAVQDSFPNGDPLEVLTADGDRVPVEIAARAVDVGDSRVVQGYFRDISERLERERRLEEYASIVSHDLRNPLNVVQGRLQLAVETEEFDHLAAAADAADRMERLIDNLLGLARQGRDLKAVEPVALADVAANAWDHVVTDGATITVETTRTVEADPNRLVELFENLFRNAIQHGASDERGVAIRVGDTETGFFVEDDGDGIDPAQCENVFDRGFTTVDDGTGFGLAIVERIATAHDWTVSATDGPGGERTDSGARFEIDV